MRSFINYLMRFIKEEVIKNRGKAIFDEIIKGIFLGLTKYRGL